MLPSFGGTSGLAGSTLHVDTGSLSGLVYFARQLWNPLHGLQRSVRCRRSRGSRVGANFQLGIDACRSLTGRDSRLAEQELEQMSKAGIGVVTTLQYGPVIG
jgi:hypothetical protein